MAGAAQLKGEKTGWRLCKRIENVCCDKKRKILISVSIVKIKRSSEVKLKKG